MLVIVATYNEIDNLPRLVHQLNAVLPEAEILVIDDASPDGTGNWCEEAKTKFPGLSTIHREGKLGLGSAAIAGFRWAAERDFDLVATMDADLSHAPKSLVEMYQKMNSANFDETDVMIGSRYVEGGGTEGWPLARRLASRVVNGFARTMLRLKTKDNSGAFRIYRSRVLSKLDFKKLKSSDYAYLEEMLWRLNKTGATMAEHPIVFRNREQGRSKTSPWLGLHVFWQITQMGLGRWS
jgi:dolichol-phosphate mannosyltransferase